MRTGPVGFASPLRREGRGAPRRFAAKATAAAAIALLALVPALAQTKAEPDAKWQLPVPPPMPDNAKIVILIQNSMIALNQGNLTGNYSVLRDLATPGFQSTNSAAQLAESFADLRKRKIDLSPIVVFQPKLVRQPAIDDKGFLRLVGFYETRPEQVQFELLFAVAGGQWRLHGLGVRTVPAPAAQAPAAQAPPQPKADAKAAKKK